MDEPKKSTNQSFVEALRAEDPDYSHISELANDISEPGKLLGADVSPIYAALKDPGLDRSKQDKKYVMERLLEKSDGTIEVKYGDSSRTIGLVESLTNRSFFEEKAIKSLIKHWGLENFSKACEKEWPQMTSGASARYAMHMAMESDQFGKAMEWAQEFGSKTVSIKSTPSWMHAMEPDTDSMPLLKSIKDSGVDLNALQPQRVLPAAGNYGANLDALMGNNLRYLSPLAYAASELNEHSFSSLLRLGASTQGVHAKIDSKQFTMPEFFQYMDGAIGRKGMTNEDARRTFENIKQEFEGFDKVNRRKTTGLPDPSATLKSPWSASN